MIIAAIVGPTLQEAFAQIAAAGRSADMIELRLDMIARPNIARLIDAARKPVIATCRPIREGGRYAGPERERIGMLELAAVFGAAYVDIELSTSPDTISEFVARRKETKVIASHHVLDGSVFDIRHMYQALNATGADVVKFAYQASDAWENHLAFDFLARAKADRRSAVAIALGEAGAPSRILYRKFGGWATYASVDASSPAAPGQIPVEELKGLYRADQLTPATKVYGVVGNPIRQSKGVQVHNPLFHRAKKNAVYCRFLVNDLALFMKHIAPIVEGFSVTLPHKQAIMPYLDEIDPAAKAIGAVNTVTRRGRKTRGTNTDSVGALDAIEQTKKVKGARLLILGAGGAARAIAYEAQQRGANVMIANRTVARGRELAQQMGMTFVKWTDIRRTHFDILVNATSVGMAPMDNASPVPESILRRKVVFDAVYNPPETMLLKKAKKVRARTIAGTEMYINQAALQSQMYTGRKPSIALMRKLLFGS
jgi:3-dehydroquinate dehydratase/shikimate dehydrogenase